MIAKSLAACLAVAFALPSQAQQPGQPAEIPAPEAAPRLPPMAPNVMVISKRPELTRAARRKLQGLTSNVAAAGERGPVVMSLCISATGSVSNPQIVRSSGYPRLDRMTLDMADSLTFTPAQDRDGKPVALCDPPYSFVWNWEQ